MTISSLPIIHLSLTLISILPFSIPPSTSPSRSIHLPHSPFVTDYGATGDGTTYDTIPIQLAIDTISSSGGGRVIFPPGNYLTSTIFLKSGVVLEIQRNAAILGGTRLEDYPAEADRWYVVVAEDAIGVGITGGGEINGQGLKFVKRYEERKNVMVSWNETGACLGDECRPRLVGFLRCKDVRVWDVKLHQPAYWWCVLPLSLFTDFSLTHTNTHSLSVTVILLTRCNKPIRV